MSVVDQYFNKKHLANDLLIIFTVFVNSVAGVLSVSQSFGHVNSW